MSHPTMMAWKWPIKGTSFDSVLIIVPRSSQRPKRKKHFPRLSDIDKAKLKNKPYAEREKAFDRESSRQGGRRVTSIDLVDENT